MAGITESMCENEDGDNSFKHNVDGALIKRVVSTYLDDLEKDYLYVKKNRDKIRKETEDWLYRELLEDYVKENQPRMCQ